MENKIFGVKCNAQDSLIEIDHNRIAVGDSSIWIVNIINSKIEKEFYVDSLISSLLLFKDGKIMVGNIKGIIYIYDEEGRKLEEKKCHDREISGLIYLNENCIITSGLDGHVKIWG